MMNDQTLNGAKVTIGEISDSPNQYMSQDSTSTPSNGVYSTGDFSDDSTASSQSVVSGSVYSPSTTTTVPEEVAEEIHRPITREFHCIMCPNPRFCLSATVSAPMIPMSAKSAFYTKVKECDS